MTEVVATPGAIRCAKPQSNRHHQHPTFYRPDALPVTQLTVSKHWRENITLLGLASPQAHLGVFQLSLWPLGGGLTCLSSALWCQYPGSTYNPEVHTRNSRTSPRSSRILFQFCFHCIQLTLSVSSPGMGCAPIYMLTTPNYTASAHQASQMISRASCLHTCVKDIAKWMDANRLQLNAAKTEILWCSSQRRVDQLPSQPFLICGSSVDLTSVIRDLGVWIDNGLTMSTHITKVVASCIASLWQLYSIRRSLSHESFTRLD